MGQKLGKSSSYQKFQNPAIAESEEVLIKSGTLTCPVCYNLFHRCPSVFPCGHSICLSCLKGLWRSGASGGAGIQKLDCPLCRRSFIFPSVNLVPQNYVLKEILDSLKEISENDQFLVKDENLKFELASVVKQNAELKQELKESEVKLEQANQQLKFWCASAIVCFMAFLLSSLSG